MEQLKPNARSVYLSVEEGRRPGERLLTLWDEPGEGRTSAAVTILPSGRLSIESRGAVAGATDLIQETRS